MPVPIAKSLLIVGWDAADWKIIDPLLAAGKMPNLQRLIEQGVRADLASLDPKLSPILWTSIATGKTADKHGILNFIEPDAAGGGVRVVSSTSRKTKAIWNMLSQADRRSIVVNWYATHPAEPIRGVCVSNMFQEGCPQSAKQPWNMPAGAVHPPELQRTIAASRVHPATLALHELRQFVPGDVRLTHDDRRFTLLRRLAAQCHSVHNAALAILKSQQEWDCAMVFYDMIDVAGHHFMQYHPPRMPHVSKRDFADFSGVMNGVYHMHDRLLGELLAAVGDDATVMVLSDHGFHSDHLRPAASAAVHDEHAAMDATWHRPTGMLAMSGPGVKKGGLVHSAGLLDIAPTALTLLGLPTGEDMDGRALAEALVEQPGVARIASWDALDGDAGMHPPDLRTDAFEASAALQQLADLGYIQPIGADVQAAIDAADRESRFNLGVVYMSTQRPRLALPLFDRLHREHPDEVRYVTNLAHCQQLTGHANDAEAVLSRFVALHPNRPEARRLHAHVQAAQGRFQEAAVVMQAVAREHPNDVESLSALAEFLRLADRLHDAKSTSDRALAMDPKNAQAYLVRSKIALAERAFEPAAEYLLEALALQPRFPEAHYLLGVALAWLGELGHAAQSFRIALSQSPGMIDAHRFLGEICKRTGESLSAEALCKEADRLASQIDSSQAPRIDDHLARLGPSEWVKANMGSSTPA